MPWTLKLPQKLAGALPPEQAHRLAIKALSAGAPLIPRPTPSLRLATSICGLPLSSPVGVAAGFDKNAEAVDGLLALGAGFVEVGAVTPRPQVGNPKPRVFRLSADRAIINRLGFNNDGMDATGDRLRARRDKGGVIGVNIGANANSVDRIADYAAVFRHLFGLADFFTLNVSSPNTSGLRELQAREAFEALLEKLTDEREALSSESGVPPAPLLVKVAPDLDEAALAEIAEICVARGIDGVIATNTTVSRPEGLQSAASRQAGGLSGPPLREMATAAVRVLRRASQGRLQIIGVGGIETAEHAYEKIRAGATALQLYTSLVYAGPTIFAQLIEGLDGLLQRDGLSSVADAVGVDA